MSVAALIFTMIPLCEIFIPLIDVPQAVFYRSDPDGSLMIRWMTYETDWVVVKNSVKVAAALWVFVFVLVRFFGSDLFPELVYPVESGGEEALFIKNEVRVMLRPRHFYI